MSEDRYSRQEGLVGADLLKNASVGIAGCGAIGRQVAIQLITMGIGSLTYADFDVIEDGNLGTQGWYPSDTGRTKVEALTDQLMLINPHASLTPRVGRYPDQTDVDVLFMCVDTMEAREQLFEAYMVDNERLGLLVDARMAADTIRVLCVDQHSSLDEEQLQEARDAYAETLFNDADAFQATCTTRGTIYLANMAAALMIRQYVAWLNRVPFATDLTLGLASMELSTNL